MQNIKSMLIGSRLESAAESAKWLMGSAQRLKHPELWEIYQEQRLFTDVLKRLLLPSSNALDVGCHLGSVLDKICKLAPDGTHTAIEPSREKSLRLRVKYPNVRVKAVAVSDFEGKASFEENAHQPGFSKLHDGAPTAGNSYYDVRVATLDSLNLGKIDFMKMDIEGAELPALKGGNEFIAANRPRIIFECGTEYGLGSETRLALYDYLTNDIRYSICSFTDFIYEKGAMGRDEFRRCGLYPFRAFNFVALP